MKTMKLRNLPFIKRPKAEKLEKEISYLKEFKKEDNKFLIGTINYEAKTPDLFVQKVNAILSKIQGKCFKLRNVKIYNVFFGKDCKFLYTIYALHKKYGIFFIVVNENKIFFQPTETINVVLKKAEYYRIYKYPRNNAPSCYDKFYLCKCKRGIVRIYGIFKEWQNIDGIYETHALYSDKKIFPVKYKKIIKQLP